MARPIATATISFGLVTIPVKLFSATEASEKISFNMLHRDCGSRVQQQYICPKDERTVDRSEIAKGYEFAKGQYVIFSEEELKALEEKATQTVEITEFVPIDQIDPIYFQKGYYLAPDRGAERAYGLLSRALEETGRWALAKYAARGKQYLVVVRPLEEGLVLQQLFYPNEVRAIGDLEIGKPEMKPKEVEMAIKVAELMASDEFRPDEYRDEVTERTRELIQEKIEGKEITSTPTEKPQAQVIDLMEALRASLAGGGPRRSRSSQSEEIDDRKPARRSSKLTAVKPAPAAKPVAKAAGKRK
jgi:DNA end-binding protein Ku